MLYILLKRPLSLLMVVLMIMLIGMFMFLRIPIDLFPDLNLPVITVTAKYPGASPEEIEDQLTRKIEEELADLENLSTINSTSTQHVAQIMLQFNWGTDLNIAESQIRSKLNRIMEDLPATMEDPIVEKINPADKPIVELVLVGEKDIRELTLIAEEQVKAELQKVKGVSAIHVFGGQENEVHIRLDQEKLKQYGISLANVQEVLKKDNLTLALGSVAEGKKDIPVKSQGKIATMADLEYLPISSAQGLSLRLKDLGEVMIQPTETTQTSYFNQRNAVTIYIYKQSDANTIDVASKVTEKVKHLQSQLGENQLTVINDSSSFISKSVKNLTKAGLLGAGLATLIIYFFLGELVATLVIALAIPLSIMTSFLFMYFSGLTINLVTLGALTLSIGLMVDDAIVVLQNIYRHVREEGKSIYQAAIEGTREVVSAVFSATMTKMIVFLPMLFVSGMAGQIFKPLALTVIYGLFASLLVSFTVTPVLTALVLKFSQSTRAQKQGRWSLLLDKGRQQLEQGYKKLLIRALNYRKTVFLLAILSLVAGVALLPMVGKEFMPKMDAGEFTIHLEMAPNTNIEETQKMVDQVLTKVNQIEQKESTYVGLGFAQSNPEREQTDKAFIHVQLKDAAERTESTGAVIESLRQQLTFAGVQIKIQEKGFIVSSLFSSDPIFISIKGEDLQILERISEDILSIIREIPGIRDPQSSLAGKKVEYVLHFDKQKLKSYGLDVLQVSSMLRMAMEGEVLGVMSTDTGDINIRISYQEEQVKSMPELTNLLIATKQGMIPLQTLVNVEQGTTSSDIFRENQLRMSFVTAGLYNTDLGQVNEMIQQKLAAYALPQGYSIEFGGETKDMQESFGDLGVALLLAVALIYMVMVAEFESFKYPFIIMFTIPLTLFGITASLVFFERNLSVSSIMGVIMLSGIIVGNGIIMIEFMKQLRDQGLDAYETVLKAAPIRLTPILMTTGTAILGVLPIALGVGEGSEMNAPMATVVLGGLSIGTLLTLFVIPTLYYTIEKNSRRKKKWVPEEQMEE